MKGSPVVALVLGALGLFLVVVGPEMWAPSASLTAHVAVGLLAAVYLAIMVGLAVRDTIVFSYLIFLLGLFGLVGVAMMHAVELSWSGKSMLVLAVSVSGLVAGAGYAIMYWRGRDVVPDIIRVYVSKDCVYETRGIEFAWINPAELRSGTVAPVEVLLQNCIDATRKVSLQIRETRNYPWSKDSLAWRAPGEIDLGSSEVKRVTFPICALPGAGGDHTLDIRLKVTGDGGRRSRRQRAPGPPRPISLFLDLLLTLVQLPMSLKLDGYERGGLRLTIVDVELYPDAGELPEPSLELLGLSEGDK